MGEWWASYRHGNRLADGAVVWVVIVDEHRGVTYALWGRVWNIQRWRDTDLGWNGTFVPFLMTLWSSDLWKTIQLINKRVYINNWRDKQSALLWALGSQGLTNRWSRKAGPASPWRWGWVAGRAGRCASGPGGLCSGGPRRDCTAENAAH